VLGFWTRAITICILRVVVVVGQALLITPVFNRPWYCPVTLLWHLQIYNVTSVTPATRRLGPSDWWCVCVCVCVISLLILKEGRRARVICTDSINTTTLTHLLQLFCSQLVAWLEKNLATLVKIWIFTSTFERHELPVSMFILSCGDWSTEARWMLSNGDGLNDLSSAEDSAFWRHTNKLITIFTVCCCCCWLQLPVNS